MERSQLTGAVIMVASIFQVILFLCGAARKSYAVLALPLFGLLSATSVLAFWIGWTMFTSETEIEDEVSLEAHPSSEDNKSK